MPLFTRRLMARFMDETDGAGSDLGGGDTATEETPTPAELADKTEGEPAAPAKAAEEGSPDQPKSMLEAINKGLEKADPAKEKPETPPAKKEDEKPQAEDVTQMPEGLSEKAQGRFKRLVETVKAKDAELAQVRQQAEEAVQARDQYFGWIKDAGISRDQLGAFHDYARALNSGDLNTVRNLLVSELRAVSLQMGIPLDDISTAADPLVDFPDLAEQVSSFRMTREAAMEIAKLRSAEKQRTDAITRENATRQSQQDGLEAWNTQKNAAITAVDNMMKGVKGEDPAAFLQIETIMAKPENKARIKQIMENSPPTTWLAQIEMVVSTLRSNLPRTSAAGEPRPLSGGGGKPQGTGQAPKSMFDAMFGR